MPGELAPAIEVVEELSAKPSVWQRLGAAKRSVSLVPSGDRSGLGATIQRDAKEARVIVSPVGFEPGAELAGTLTERGVEAPPSWRLMADVGVAMGWAAPPETGAEELVAFPIRVLESLCDVPAGASWTAELIVRTPRSRSPV